MKRKDVIISISGWQVFGEDSFPDSIELITDGHLEKKDGRFILTYCESEITGMDGTVTTLLVDPQAVTMLRSGSVETHMVFERGAKHLSHYDFGSQALTIGIHTRRVLSTLSENGGDVEMEYEMEIDNTLAGENAVKISVKEALSPTSELFVPAHPAPSKFLN